MISKDYKQNKEQVLAIYDGFAAASREAGKEVSESLCRQAEKIRNEVFNLMILGEAKSGKSTFINAYLGKEIVPMDVRQCTSAIIKIRRGDSFELVARSAAGGMTSITGYDRIREFLKSHAAISDKYRSIPITTINNELLIKYKGKPISTKDMDSFLRDEAKDNIFRMDPNEYNELIREYVAEHAADWGKIITEIDIRYPLSEEMQGITIIDSPGVGAGGNVGQIAEDYIKEANAIIFVKSLNGQALEDSSFMNFMRSNCTDRKKDSLFLVLTGKANLQGSEFARLREQAEEMYKRDIQLEKIVCVDSKVQLFLNKCRELGTEERIQEFFDRLEAEGDEFAVASNCWLKARGDIDRFEDSMEDQSNFGSVQAVIERFARVANYVQLIEFLECLEKECARYQGMYRDALNVAEENLDDPDALKARISEKKLEITEVYNKISAGVQDIYSKYTDNINGEGVIMAEADKCRARYEAKLENFLSLTKGEIKDRTFNELKIATMNTIDDIQRLRREIAERVIAECNEKLIQCTDDPSGIPAEAYIPNFTETDFEAIDAEALAQTSGVTSSGGTCFSAAKRVPYHHLREHVRLVVNSIRSRLDTEIIPKMTDNAMNYVRKCTEIYKDKLTRHKQELETEYTQLLADRESNEQRRQNVEELKRKLTVIDAQSVSIKSMKEELKNYVGE